MNTKQIGYDIFGFPHESLHSAREVLNWFKETNVRYKGSFAPLRIRDYLYAFSQPEYFAFRSTFSGFPVMRWVADSMTRVAKLSGSSKETIRNFPTPGGFSSWLCQMSWILFGLRFNCFTISGTKMG